MQLFLASFVRKQQTPASKQKLRSAEAIIDMKGHGTGKLQWRLPWQSMACRGKEVTLDLWGPRLATRRRMEGSDLPLPSK
jgi:hypothetical protein